MRGRHVDKTMFLADCKGTQFEVIKTFADVKSGSAEPDLRTGCTIRKPALPREEVERWTR